MSRATRAHVAEAVKDAPDRIAAERIGLTAFIAFVRQHRELYRIIEEAQFIAADVDRKSVVKGKSVSVRLDIGDRRIIKNKSMTKSNHITKHKQDNQHT